MAAVDGRGDDFGRLPLSVVRFGEDGDGRLLVIVRIMSRCHGKRCSAVVRVMDAEGHTVIRSDALGRNR